jgi:hypothetical protein
MEFLVNMKAAGHDHGYQAVPSDPTLRVKAIESLLVDMKRFPALSGRLFAAFITLCFAGGFTGGTQAQMVAFGASKIAEKAYSLAGEGRPIKQFAEGTVTMFTSKMRAFPGHEPTGRIHLPAESYRLFAEQLLPNVISALGGSRPG